jgi:hypothetical protein
MDLKNSLQYLFDRLRDVRPVTHKVGDQEYAVQGDGTLGAPVPALAPQWDKPVFEVGTLSALAELFKSKVDEFPAEVALWVANYRYVKLVSLKADEFGRRHVYAAANHSSETPFKFGEYMPAEKFLIDFRTSFLYTEDAIKVQKVVSSLESGQSIATADDGLSQAIEMRAGTVTKNAVTLPADGIPLAPWRTFRDAAPVESKFLLRLRGVKDQAPQAALFEIDQKWHLDTVNSIGVWLKKHVPDATIIA